MNIHTKDQEGNSYRLLDHGEIVREGDQAYIPNNSIVLRHEITSVWFTIGNRYAGSVYDARLSILRRKIIDAPYSKEDKKV